MKEKAHELAVKIAAEIFTNGEGKHAQRINLEMPGYHYGGGYCEYAIVQIIEKHLMENENDQQKKDK